MLFDYANSLLIEQPESADFAGKQQLIECFNFCKILYAKTYFAPEKINLNIKIEQALAFHELYKKHGINLDPYPNDQNGIEYVNQYKMVIRQTIFTINQKCC